jgi:two-component system, OmpR family, response regulator CpxR
LEVEIMANFPAGTVLCVDDELDALELRKKVLESRGYRVLIATNAQEALRFFDTEHIDLVLTDHLLRGQTGTALAAEMKRRKPDVAVAIYSGVAQTPEDIHQADIFITKLVTPEELLAYLEAILTAKKTGRHNAAKAEGAGS